jgi:hypothetical protein
MEVGMELGSNICESAHQELSGDNIHTAEKRARRRQKKQEKQVCTSNKIEEPAERVISEAIWIVVLSFLAGMVTATLFLILSSIF